MAGLAVALVTGCDGPVAIGLSDEQVYATHREVEVGFRGDDGAVLSGTLMLPLGRGPFPAAVWHFGSGPWTRVTYEGSQIPRWLGSGVAVLTYDKRGVGLSQGECCSVGAPGALERLGGDVLSGVRAIAAHPDVDAAAIGAFGFSQGGWVVPVAAARGGNVEVAWLVIGSGPTVTLGEELLYSALAGEPECRRSGLSDEEIDARLAAAGPSGFDPLPYLRTLTQPGLWIYGERDESIPVRQSVAILADLIAQGKPFETIVIPTANHRWVLDGDPCQATGPTQDMVPTILDWILSR